MFGTLDDDLAANRASITELLQDTAPKLRELTEIEAVVAASVLIAWSHPGRVRSDAAAFLAGTCPIAASSATPPATASTAAATDASTGR